MSLTTDNSDPRLNTVGEDGQNLVYLVLSEEERAKGFVRPVRHTYVHVGLEEPAILRPLTADEAERHKGCNYVAFEDYPPERSPLVGRYWTQEQLDNRGCGTETIMGNELAETYARDPNFYGSTFCCKCRKHFPVSEFIWKDGTRVGS